MFFNLSLEVQARVMLKRGEKKGLTSWKVCHMVVVFVIIWGMVNVPSMRTVLLQGGDIGLERPKRYILSHTRSNLCTYQIWKTFDTNHFLLPSFHFFLCGSFWISLHIQFQVHFSPHCRFSRSQRVFFKPSTLW